MTALIARCARCNSTAPVERQRDILTGDLVDAFAPHGAWPHGACTAGGQQAGEVLEDTPENREALALKWIGKEVCPECQQRPVARKGLCRVCADLRERPRFSYREPVRRYRLRGRR